MNKDEIKGTANKVKGSVKEAVGKATGNERLQGEAQYDKAKGEAQKRVGEAKDAVRH